MVIAVSIVSHRHGAMVGQLVSQLRQCPDIDKIVVTQNVPCGHEMESDDRVEVIVNSRPKGFGANHNAAFRHCHEQYFCVLNPDIALREDPFPALVECATKSGAAIVAPLIMSPRGEVEDSARHFPTVKSLAMKALGQADGRWPFPSDMATFSPDWVAGMFMLFRSSDFTRLGGFDERYYLYYEDVDICRRAHSERMKVVVCPAACAVHDARRASRRNIRHAYWHLMSMARYLWTTSRLRA